MNIKDEIDEITKQDLKMFEEAEQDFLRWGAKIGKSFYDQMYDAKTFQSYAIKLILLFGKDEEVTIPADITLKMKKVFDEGYSGIRIDQRWNDDGSLSLKLAYKV